MNRYHEHTNLPMKMLTNIGKEDRYGYHKYYFDMDGYNQSVFSNFHVSGSRDFLPFDGRLDSVHGSKNNNGHSAICRPRQRTCSRRLSSFLSRRSLEYGRALANIDAYASRNDYFPNPMQRRNLRFANCQVRQERTQPSLQKRQTTSLPEKMAYHVRDWKKVKVRERGKTQTRLLYARKVLWYRVSHKPILLVISREPPD